MFRRKEKTLDRAEFFTLIPHRTVEWEVRNDNKIVLLVPKFRRGLGARWLQPWIRRKHIRVSLDEFGSFIWNCCDGSTSIESIAGKMRQQFGERVEPVQDRLSMFMNRLVRGELITFEQPFPTQSTNEN
ncbi:MAG: PqqD family protein [Ignavibacteria bacterium]|nr:PqqD family protein [Ignavibacteria bacterium]